MHRLVLVRHGQSEWNKENRFTGWTDISLSEQGIVEAKSSGRLLKEKGFVFDKAYVSNLTRAIQTLFYLLDEMHLLWIPTEKNWRLNERHYGALQGLNKAETADKYGAEQVHIWRRSYDVAPPKLEASDPRCPHFDANYADIDRSDLPFGESLKDTITRVLPYWRNTIVPEIQKGKNLVISAHGNSIRALVKIIDNVSDDDIVEVNIPNGTPLIYEFHDDMSPIRSYYLNEKE